MASTISTTIAINDNMSKALQSVSKSVSTLITNFERLEKSSSGAIDTKSLAAARRYISDAEKAFMGVEKTVEKARKSVKGFGNDTSTLKSRIGQISSALNGITVGIGAVTAAAGLAAKKIANISDTVIQTRARLDLMNDGMQTTEELQQKIYDSATRARGAYQDTADAVSKMGILAGDTFTSNDEIIAFMEQVNKQFAISGTSTQGVQAAMLQLTQAMGSGLLRGEELNSVLEQAPTIVQTIAKYLGVGVGTLREMASDGLVTSEVVKTALLGAADETNKKFESMPMTFGQVWTDFKNRALMAFQPVLEKINELANSGELDRMLDQATNMLTKLGDAALSVFTWMSEHGDIVKAALIGIGIAITAMTVAMWAFNIAAMANPVVWIVLAIIAAVALLAAGIYLLVKNWDAVSAAAGACWNAIKGFFAGVGEWFANIWNTIVTAAQNAWNGIASAAQGAWNGIKSLFSAIGGFFAGVWDGIASVVQSAWNGIVSVISSAWNAIWSVISPVVMAVWNLISAIFGAIASIIGAVMQGIWATIQRVWSSVVSFITPILQTIWATVTTIWNGIASTITAVCTSIWSAIVNIWNGITSTITAAAGAVWAVISSVWESISTTTKNIWGSVKSTIAGIWDNIVKAVTDKAKEIYTSVKNKFDEIVNFIGNLKNTMIQKGKDIIQGLIDGVASKINALANKIREIGQTVTNGIKSFFNIGSPSKVMRELGQWTFEGFNLGLDDMISRIKRTTLNMGGTVTETSEAEFAGVRKAAGNSSAAHTTIHAPITIRIANSNEFKSDADITTFTRRLANGIAQQIGVQLEGVTA